MKTIVYLVRHSEKFNNKEFGEINSNDDLQIKNEKQILSVNGEKLAKELSEKEEFKNISAVYSSSYVRAMQTAKYFIHNKNLKLNIDERFNERKTGTVDIEKYPTFWKDQYLNKEFKMEDGESQEEVNKRMTEAFYEVVNKNKGKEIVVVSHGTAISFLLMNWCKLIDVQMNKLRCFEFNGKIIINEIFKAPLVFKVMIDEDDKVEKVECVEM